MLDGVRGGAVGRGTALQVGKSRVLLPTVSTSNSSEYQEYFLGGGVGVKETGA